MTDNRPCALKLMGFIVDRSKTNKVVDIFREQQVRFHFICLAQGTAGSDILAVLGLDSTDKSFICCLEPDYKVHGLLSLVSERLQLRKPGKGIAFTMPLTGINSSVLQLLQGQNEEAPREKEEKKMETCGKTTKYDLILSVVNQGYDEDVMDAAKGAGARGGTILHGRKISVADEAKFFGIPIQAEKDIVTILTTHEKKGDIMKAINQACGMATEARGIIFSLPIEDIEGFGEIREPEASK